MDSKVCNTCKVEKTLDNYPVNSKSPDGLGHKCKACLSAYYYERQEYTKKRSKENWAIYYEKNKKKINQKHRKLYRTYTPGVYYVLTEEGDYVGESNAIEARVYNHKWTGKKKGHGNFPIQAKVLEWKILEVVEDKKERLERESYYIKLLKPSINIRKK